MTHQSKFIQGERVSLRPRGDADAQVPTSQTEAGGIDLAALSKAANLEIGGDPGSSGSAIGYGRHVEQPSVAPVADDPEYDLPGGYGQTYLMLMVRDPYWIYSYWELAPVDLKEVAERIGADQWGYCRRVLRVHDVTGSDYPIGGSHHYFDIPLSGDANRWYINAPAANRDYCAEIILISPSGTEYLLARSNRVQTPRDGISDVLDEEWMVLEEFDRLYWMSSGFGPSSPEFQRPYPKRGLFHELNMGSGAVSSILMGRP